MSSKDVKLTERDMQLLGIAMRNATAKPDVSSLPLFPSPSERSH